MNNKHIYLFIILFICCSKDFSPNSTIISNTIADEDIPDGVYSLILDSNSGSEIERVSIYWKYVDAMIMTDLLTLEQQIINNTGSIMITDMFPGEFRDIQFDTTVDDIEYRDTIQIFTRSLNPIRNLSFELETIQEGNGEWDEGESWTDLGNDLWDEGEIFDDFGTDGIENSQDSDGTESNGIWDEGESWTDLGNDLWDEGEPWVDLDETKYKRILKWSPPWIDNENILEYRIFRRDNQNVEQLLHIENCIDCLIGSTTDTVYVDSSVQYESGNYSYYYRVQFVSLLEDGSGKYVRNSLIPNYSAPPAPPKIAINENNLSTNKKQYIQINWDAFDDYIYFYEYYILRSPNEDHSSGYVLDKISNNQINYYQDRDGIGDGNSWYYSIAIMNVVGEITYSNYAQGWTLP